MTSSTSAMASLPGARHLGPGTILRIALFTGFLLGLMEAGTLAFSRHVLHQLIYQGVHYLWLAPLVDAGLFFALGLIVVILSHAFPRVANVHVIAWIFIFALVLGLRSAVPRIYLASWLILACGTATFASRWCVSRLKGCAKLLNRLTFASVIILCVLASATGLWQYTSERLAIAGLPEAAADMPNVLWLVMDTVPAKRMSLYGYPRRTTPNIDRFAQSGVVFENCMSSSSWTLPGHATMFSGRMRHEQDCGWSRPLGDHNELIAETLKKQGYATAGFAANMRYLSREFGIAQGFCRYREPTTLFGQALQCSYFADALSKRTIRPVFNGRVIGRKSARTINRECLAWLEQQSRDRPFFAFLNYMEAHTPYSPSVLQAERFGADESVAGSVQLDGGAIPQRAGWLKDLVRTYDACVADLDDQIGSLLSQLEERGLLENTIVILTADHGEQLGEHDLLYHSNSLYTPQIHVPLVISYPSFLPSNRRVDTVVSLADLPATVMDLLGPSIDHSFPRTSLVKRIEGQAPGAAPFVTAVLVSKGERLNDRLRRTPIAKGSMCSVISTTHQYILNGDGSEEFYAYEQDLAEETNLIGSGQHQELLARMRQAAEQIPLEDLPTFRAGDNVGSSLPHSAARPLAQRIVREK